ncbi:protein kinase, partial [Myxococcota bacterium]|nr:protein kinase [Myxococcota bacterium]
MKACPHCHRQNGPERKFCAECGADLQGGVDQGGVRHTPVPPGTVFEGKYEILSELGRGGMGVVYRGKDLSLERQVAIKVLPEKFNTEPEVIERFQREAKAMASLDHPNIIPVYAIGQQDNFHYFAMKYLDGETIAQTLERLRPRGEAFSPSVVQGVIVQVCKGLAHAHRQGLIHRDIKPGNIMLSETGHVTIMDFGIVKKDQNGDDENNLTKTGLVFGTPEYMAPEQAQGLAPPGPTTDLYAVGIVAYEMLTGRPPFEGGSPFSIVFKHIKNPPAPLVDRIPGLNPAFEGLVFKSLEKDPKARYQSAEAMYKAFEAFSFHAPHPSPASGAAVGAAAPLHAAPPAVPAFKLDNLNFDLSGVPLDDEDPGLSARRAAPPGVYAGGPPQAPGAP